MPGPVGNQPSCGLRRQNGHVHRVDDRGLPEYLAVASSDQECRFRLGQLEIAQMLALPYIVENHEAGSSGQQGIEISQTMPGVNRCTVITECRGQLYLTAFRINFRTEVE